MEELFKRTTLCLCMVIIPAIAQSQPKVWELENTVRKQTGDVHLSMEKNFSRNAPVGDFWANAINSRTGVSGIFRGVCAAVIEVDVTATDIRKINLAAFTASKSGNDLPISDVLTVLQDALTEQCEQLEVMRISFNVSNAPEDYSYLGTAQRSNGWRLQDGLITTAHDNSFVFEINQRDMFSVAGVYYKGGCEPSPRMLLEPRYANNTERALSELPDMAAYVTTAQSASLAYHQQCPDTRRIEFALNPIPDDFICAHEGACFLSTRFDGEWVAEIDQFKRKTYNNPIQNANDVVEVLAAGRFDILSDYDAFLRFYTEVWFGVYSDHCRADIENPVLRQTQIVEREYDEFGGLVNEDFGPIRDIWIESSQASVFDSVLQTWKGWAVARMVGQIAAGNKGGRNPFDTVARSMGFFTGTIDEVEATLRGQCADPQILTARDNMIRYFRSEPAITGRYTTQKKPQNSYPENVSSAPHFVQSVLDQRAAEQQKIQSVRHQARAAADSERQARIQRDIEARTPGEQSAAPDPAQVDPQQRYQDMQANLAKLQEIAQDHANRLAEVSKDFRARISAATDPAERRALQQAFQEVQAGMQEGYQSKVQQLMPR
ncbi:MAG: hypothetical protein ACFHXK_06590 [bacterium]